MLHTQLFIIVAKTKTKTKSPSILQPQGCLSPHSPCSLAVASKVSCTALCLARPLHNYPHHPQLPATKTQLGSKLRGREKNAGKGRVVKYVQVWETSRNCPDEHCKIVEPGEKGLPAAMSAKLGAEDSVLLMFTPFSSSVLILSPRTHCAVRQLDIYANSLGKAERINTDTQSKGCNSEKPTSVPTFGHFGKRGGQVSSL